jgi:hypothetical protein
MYMFHHRGSGCLAIAAGMLALVCGAGRASAQSETFPPPPPSDQAGDLQALAANANGQDFDRDEPTTGAAGSADQLPIPPGVEGAPYPSSYGGYCYVGSHPADPRASQGDIWDPTEGRHVRSYPPVDLRLFAYEDGCYYFIGDPHDFGYGGPAYSYYGAHPILATYGGGWCFMIGGHAHVWAPWSSQFAVVGPWYYWRGVYDPFFWTYWPYYSAYYRAYYPRYYGRGQFYRGGGYRTAPPLGRGYAGGSTWTASAASVAAAPSRQARPATVTALPATAVPVRPSSVSRAPGPSPRGFAPSGSLRSPGVGFRAGRR